MKTCCGTVSTNLCLSSAKGLIPRLTLGYFTLSSWSNVALFKSFLIQKVSSCVLKHHSGLQITKCVFLTLLLRLRLLCRHPAACNWNDADLATDRQTSNSHARWFRDDCPCQRSMTEILVKICHETFVNLFLKVFMKRFMKLFLKPLQLLNEALRSILQNSILHLQCFAANASF